MNLRIYRYHDSANRVISMGVVTGLVAYCWFSVPPVVGFLAGAVPTFVAFTIHHATYDE